MSLQEINPDEFYSPRKLVAMKVVPWKGAMTFDRKLKQEQWIEIFKPLIEIVEGKRKIYIKGDNIIKFQELASKGLLNKKYEKQ